MVRWLQAHVTSGFILDKCAKGYIYQQVCGLVNVKMKWVKDRVLDSVVAGEKDLKAVCVIISIISADPRGCSPIYHIARFRGQLGLPYDLKVFTFVRQYPTIFNEKYIPDSGGTPVPWFCLTPEALNLYKEELNFFENNQTHISHRLCKFLMLTKEKTLPLQTIDQVKWDMGLPYDYEQCIVHRHPHLFKMCQLPDERSGLKLLSWDNSLSPSQLEKDATKNYEDLNNGVLAFPIRFTRGYGLKRKCMRWLEEWQKLPYTSPYLDASHLDTRTDVSEKRIVGVFHELLHLMLTKKTKRSNVSNLRKPLGLPQKFTKAFERHPGVFYISKKCNTQTVVLREGYDGHKLVHNHTLVDIRERYLQLMQKGFLDRSKGLYKKTADSNSDLFDDNVGETRYKGSGDSSSDSLSEYDNAYESEDESQGVRYLCWLIIHMIFNLLLQIL